jgi:hypothetical protein
MKQLRKRLSYANVMSTIAVFLVIGGASAFAAVQLGKNTVGSKQLKKNAVTAAKIKKNAVTAAKIKNGAVTTAKLANDAATGAKVLESSLGQVPHAANAVNAADAAKLGGQAPGAYQSRVRWALVDSGSETILAQSGGVSVVASGGVGFSYLNWGEDIGDRALQVSLAQIGEGFLTVTPCGSGESPADTSCAPTGSNNSNHTIVRMDTAAGGAADHVYFISVTK